MLRLPRSVRSVSLLTVRRRPPSRRPSPSLSSLLTSSLGVSFVDESLVHAKVANNMFATDDETDMVALEAAVRAIEHDGLVWGASKLVPVGFGIKKLQINLVVEDAKISVSDLEDEIQELEDYVQSTDVAAMQKL